MGTPFDTTQKTMIIFLLLASQFRSYIHPDLSGIVVIDSLILIDFINVEVAGGTDVFAAVVQSGETRFSPVILTSVTTVAGLAPLLTETSSRPGFSFPWP
ncbi:MAG: efflux RND transporter permease subunit [Desulfobacter sp.]